MKIYTIQTTSILPITRRYYASYQFVRENEFTRDFVALYRWMAKHMHSPLRREKTAPIWGWMRYRLKKKSPDLSDAFLGVPGTECCLIKLEVPEEHVLASQFEMWNWVLNGWKIKFNDEDCERVSLKKSWEHIFDLSFGDDGFWGKKEHRPIQVVLPCIEPKWIRKIKFFTAT